MCGIVGFFGGGDRALLERMNQAIHHRGPDDDGFFTAPGVGLAMRRLSIIDLAHGKQPIATENGRMQIVFNGEIYNYRELKAAYLGLQPFKTASDTEVVLQLYAKLGEASFAKLNGMFAFALWDEAKQALYLVRDRTGIKPLYYHQGPERLSFASELKALLQDSGIPRVIDDQALVSYLNWQYVPGPATLLQGIHKLPAGHFLRLHAGRPPVLEPYGSASAIPAARSHPRDFLPRLRGAIQRQLVSDVPVGAFLSGGVDSALLVALMAQEVGSSLETFTAGFEDPRLDESAWASLVAGHVGVRNHVVRLDSSALDDLPALVWRLDEPVADRAALPTYHLSRLAGTFVKVALSGEGSDELFAGYPRYRLEQWARQFHRVPLASRPALWRAVLPLFPAGIRSKLAKLVLSSANPGLRRAEWVASFSHSARARLLINPSPLSVPQPDSGQLEAQLRLDLESWLVDNVLMKVDKMTMAASLEARVPFLDNEMIDWAKALPDAYKLRFGVGKHVVKKAAETLLPWGVVHRPKQAFHTPTALWFREKRGQTMLSDVLLSKQARERGYFNPQEVERLIRGHQAGGNHDQALWNLLILELWLNAYVDRQPLAHAPMGLLANNG